MLLALYSFAALLVTSRALNFNWERDQLNELETASHLSPRSSFPGCKNIPGDDEWPSDAQWASFNETLGGALLKPKPLASICYSGEGYNGTNCRRLRDGWASMNYHADDPTSIHSQWPSGNTCIPTSEPNSTCTQGGYPIYVVRATSVRHIQLAVNFARDNNIRLVIKNSGHDFNGKSIGGYALSIWTHNLNDLTYLANYTSPDGSYSGRAVAYSAGVSANMGSALMARNNMTFLVAGGPTVGIAGGFLQGGGHSTYTSYYGLAADHVLALTAVTADGKVVEAHAGQNEDLFWAFRGGGGGTFGVITSVVVKAWANTPTVSGNLRWSTTPTPGSNSTNSTISTETFWAGMRAYWEFGPAICDAGGLGYNFIYPKGSAQGLTYTVSISLPNKTRSEYQNFVAPLVEKLNSLGINTSMQNLKRSYIPTFDHDAHANSLSPRALGEITGHTLIASRLFPRSAFNTSSALEASHLAIRHLVEDGDLTFHGMSYAPTLAVAGNPSNAVNPAHRTTVLHAQGYEPNAHWDGKAPVLTQAELTKRHNRLQSYMQVWRDVSPGGGSYINEGDAQDWAWKEAFFGSNYERLAAIKKSVDPTGVFWAVGAVAHNEWEVRDIDGGKREGIIVQDGRLCRVEK